MSFGKWMKKTMKQWSEKFWDIVQSNSDKPCDYNSYDRLSKNPNITWDILQANQCWVTKMSTRPSVPPG